MLTHFRFRCLIVLAGILTSSLVHAQDCHKDDLSVTCAELSAQSVYDDSDKELNAVYQQLLTKMSQKQTDNLDYPSLKTKFIDAQQQWLTFRDSECSAWFVANQVGEERNVDRTACLVTMTKERTRELNEWVSGIP